MTPEGPDCIVLTGFLGSGKTTLLRDYLAGPAAAETAIVVNEVGEIGLDGVILRQGSDTVPIAMLSNGCVCCQAGSDLAVTIDALLTAPRPHEAPPLRRIVLETSGLSKPGPVLRQLASLAEHRMRIAVLGTFDAVRGTAAAAFEEAAAQWAAAHRIVVAKGDLVDPAGFSQAAAAAINPLAGIVAFADRRATIAAAFAPLSGPSAPREPASVSPGTPHPRILTCLATPTGIIDYDYLAAWLDNLAGALGERLLRLKGLVRVRQGDATLLVQSVGTMFSPPRRFGETRSVAESFIVVIARDAGDADIADVAPANLFRLSRLTAPPVFAAPRPARGLRAEAV